MELWEHFQNVGSVCLKLLLVGQGVLGHRLVVPSKRSIVTRSHTRVVILGIVVPMGMPRMAQMDLLARAFFGSPLGAEAGSWLGVSAVKSRSGSSYRGDERSSLPRWPHQASVPRGYNHHLCEYQMGRLRKRNPRTHRLRYFQTECGRRPPERQGLGSSGASSFSPDSTLLRNSAVLGVFQNNRMGDLV
jgi:hypothetical protein